MGKTKRTRGRPIAGQQRTQKFQVTLEPRIAEILRQLGNGNLSRGITIASEQISAQPHAR
jgi:hypothetical protein